MVSIIMTLFLVGQTSAPGNPSIPKAEAADALEQIEDEPLDGEGRAKVSEKIKSAEIVYVSPRGCFLGGSTHINGARVFEEEARRAGLSVEGGALSIGVLYKDGRFLVPEKQFSDPRAVVRVLEHKSPLKKTLIESGVELLWNDYVSVVQTPRHQMRNLLGLLENAYIREKARDGYETLVADIVRYENKAGALLAVELIGAPPIVERDTLKYIVQPSFSYQVKGSATSARVFFFGKRLGLAGRVKADYDERAQSKTKPLRLFAGLTGNRESVLACGKALTQFDFDVLVPRRADLFEGAAAFKTFREKHKLPYTAVNLYERKGEKETLALPQFILHKQGELDVVVLGVVPETQLERVPPTAAATFAIRDPWQSLRRAREAAIARLGKQPDLVVAVLGGDDPKLSKQLEAQPGLDVVVADFSRWAELTERVENITLGAQRGGRERAFLHRASLIVRAAPYATGNISARFEHGRLLSLEHRSSSVAQEGPVDEAFALAQRKVSRRAFYEAAKVLFPAAEPIIEKSDELMGLATGERVLSHGRYSRVEKDRPLLSDPIWMRMVTNIVRESMRAEVSIMRNLYRGDNVGGAILKTVADSWLPPGTEIHVVNLDGASLSAIGDRIARQTKDGLLPYELYFASGFDTKSKKINGRPLDPKRHYKVAIDSTLLDDGEIAPKLKKVQTRFKEKDGKFFVAKNGEARSVRDVVHTYFALLSDDRGEYDSAHDEKFKTLLVETGQTQIGEWSFDVDQISLSLSAYQNSDNIGLFAASRETRTTTPNLLSFGVSGNLKLLYDGPKWAFETGATTQLQSTFLSIEGQNLPPQEQRDDWTLYTEGRANLIKITIGSDDFQIVPFARALIDSEFTPTPQNPEATAFFPHQFLARQELGFVAYPNRLLKEIRVGALVQEDIGEVFTGGSLFLDYGAVLGAKFGFPLFMFQFESNTDVRYLVPDSDDRIQDLSLRVQSVNRLVLPIGKQLECFVFADLFGVTGKLPENNELGFSTIFGAGLSFDETFRF